MTLNPVCESVETAQGVPLTVTGVAQVKIMKNADLLQTASEQFLGKKEHEIKSTVLQTLEGHLRAILGKKNYLAPDYSVTIWATFYQLGKKMMFYSCTALFWTIFLGY